MKRILVLFLYLSLFFTSCSEERYTDPLPPDAALKSFQLSNGFKIELFASEPYVLDPVEMIFDERGDAYVVEMPDYPYKPAAGQGKGRIIRIVDTDGDGRVDQSTVFADQISEATSIMPWQGGLLVAAAPNILYLKDTDGDHVADYREVLFSGFFENNSEAQITNLRFGIDNWIYAANFGQPGQVTFNRRPDAPSLSMQGGDFRFRLDRGLFEQETGPTQFGQALDDWGHRFLTQNTIHIRHAVIPWRYLHRHTYLPPTKADYNISDHDLEMFQQTPPPYWRAERTRRRQQSYDEQKLDRIEYAEDHFTGASGATFYDGNAYPKEFYGNIFTGDVAGNLVHRDVLMPLDDSPTFVAKRAEDEQNREFLASTDPWFRPANFTVGPDGFLYVIDMYRQHIETPVSIPEDLKADMDFYNGSQHGRIYRITTGEVPPRGRTFPNLSDLSGQKLVDLLSHPNRWQRLHAQRLILESQDSSIAPQLRALFQEHEDPRTRLHALYALEGLQLLDPDLVKQAMEDPHPGVRKHGVVLSERFAVCLPQLLEKTNDLSTLVAFQAALSLGEFSGKKVTSALASVIEQYGENDWFRTAVLSSSAGSSLQLLDFLIGRNYFSGEPEAHKTTFLKDLSYIVGARNRPGEIDRIAGKLLELPDPAKLHSWQLAGLQGLAAGIKKTNAKPDTGIRFKALLQILEPGADEALKAMIREIQ